MNILEDLIIPEAPRVLSKEQISIFVPVASNSNKGVASFYDEHFTVINGQVKIKNSYLQELFSDNFMTRLLQGLRLEVNETDTKHVISLVAPNGTLLSTIQLTK